MNSSYNSDETVATTWGRLKMTMSVSYTVFDGEIVSENRGGVESIYVPDTLGSTVAIISTGGVITDTFTYWPFGEIQSHIGSSITPFTYVGTLGYYTDIGSVSIYVRARHYRPALTRWQTVDIYWPQLMPYNYAQSNPVLFVDPSGTTAYRCTRSLRTRDMRSCPINIKTGTHHWWIYMDDQKSPCQSIGYGPGGRYGHGGNLGRGYPSDVECFPLSSDKKVEKCICDLAAKIEKGWVLCGSTWVDGPRCHTYNFGTHNCQDYVICLFHSCGVAGGFEFEQEGFPYWPPLRKI